MSLWGRSIRSSHARRPDRERPQPSSVTGPRQGVPCATITQTKLRCLHSTHTLCGGVLGLRPFKNALITSTNWCFLGFSDLGLLELDDIATLVSEC